MQPGAGFLLVPFALVFAFFLCKKLLNYWRMKKKVKMMQENPFESFRGEIVELILADKGKELDELLKLLHRAHPTSSVNELSYYRGKGSILAFSCRLGRSNAVKILLEHNADPTSKDTNNETCLHFAAKNGKAETTKTLLEFRADPNCRNFNNWTPLHWTASNGRTECTRFLLAAGADCTIASLEQQRIPLHVSVQNGHYEDTKILLEHGADIHSVDADGNTPILACSKNGSMKILSLLLENNANLNDCNHMGLTPLLRAADRGLSDFVIRLLHIDPENHLKQLISVIDSISQTKESLSLDLEERQQKLSMVLRRIIQLDVFLEPLLSLFSEKIISLSLTLLETHSNDSKKSLYTGSIQLIWLLEFILKKEAAKSNLVISTLPLEGLWLLVDENLSSYSHNVGENIDDIAGTICPIIRVYYQIMNCCLESEVEDVTFRVRFQEIVEKHNTILWTVITSFPESLVGDCDFLLFTPSACWDRVILNQLMSFEQQQNWLRRQIERLHGKFADENITITARRNEIGGPSCSSLMVGEGSLFKGKFNVKFEGEVGSGAGVRREWFSVTSRELFNPNNALFLSHTDGTLQPNSASSIHSDHLSYFRFAGRLIGLAIYHSELIDAHFTRSFYKHIIGIAPSLKDFQSSNPDFYNNLTSLLEMEDIEDLELTFTADEREFGCDKCTELKENGGDILVTSENVKEYVQLLTELKMTSGIKKQLDSFLCGLYEIVPATLLAIFNEFQIELLISGIPTIDKEDWRKHSRYNCCSAADPLIVWFWDIVESWDQEICVALLQFTTGTSSVPVGGFSQLLGHEGISFFSITKTGDNVDSLPTSATCFNLLRLPDYASKEILKEKLEMAVLSGNRGFSFV